MASNLQQNSDPLSIHAHRRTRSPPRTRDLAAQLPTTAVAHSKAVKESMFLHSHTHSGVARKLENRSLDDQAHDSPEYGIFYNPSDKHAQEMISPFLAKHIPQHHHDHSHNDSSTAQVGGYSSAKYCYRHRPDLKCRRQADEPTMDELQRGLSQLSKPDQQGISHMWALFSAAPAKIRNMMLQGILQQCCFPQLSFVSAALRDLIKIDFISALPIELGLKILCYLDTASLCKAAQVSHYWRTLADDDVIWHRMCEQHIDRKCTKCGLGLPLMERERLRLEKSQIEKRQVQLRSIGQGTNKPIAAAASLAASTHRSVSNTALTSPLHDSKTAAITHDHGPLSLKRSVDDADRDHTPPPKRPCAGPLQTADTTDTNLPLRRPWKDVYAHRFKIGNNWKKGIYSLQVLKGHDSAITCLALRDNHLASSSYDDTVKIWNVDTGELERTLEGADSHVGGIRCVHMADNLMFTGGRSDNLVKVWDWRNGTFIRNLPGRHSGGVVGIHYCSTLKTVVSGSVDHTIRVVDLRKMEGHVLEGHGDWVNSVRIDSRSRTLFSAADDTKVKMWDLDTRQCIRTFEGHHGPVQTVALLPHDFELGIDDEDEKYGHSDADYSDHDSEGRSRQSPPRYMLTSSLDGTIRMWYIPTGEAIRVFYGHVQGVWDIAAGPLRMVSGAEDHTVKVWDPRTGACERTLTGHSRPVTSVALGDSFLASGSEDGTVRLYSFEHDENTATNAHRSKTA